MQRRPEWQTAAEILTLAAEGKSRLALHRPKHARSPHTNRINTAVWPALPMTSTATPVSATAKQEAKFHSAQRNNEQQRSSANTAIRPKK
jgi:negative regulator of sigma E activity